jgi:Tat protein translocase TatB subunit
MFGIGMPEMLLILAVALIVIGPKKLPDLAKTLGRAMRELKKATSDFKDTLQVDDDLGDVKKTFDDIKSDIKDTVDITAPLKDKTFAGEDVYDIQNEKNRAENAGTETLADQKTASHEMDPETEPVTAPEDGMNSGEDKDPPADAAADEIIKEKLEGRPDDA